MSASAAGMAPSERVAEQIRDDIRQRRLKPGDKLPPHKEVASKYGIAIATVQKALKRLEEEGWVVPRPSIGVFVSDNIPTDGAPLTLTAVADQVAQLTEAVADLKRKVDGMTVDR